MLGIKIQRRLAITLCAPLVASSLVFAQTTVTRKPDLNLRTTAQLRQPMHLLKLGAPVGTAANLRSIAQTLRLKFSDGGNGAQASVTDGTTSRGYVVAGEHPKLVVLPELGGSRMGKLTPGAALEAANVFIRQSKLQTGDVSSFTPLTAEPWRSQDGAKGKLGAVQDRLLSISYARKIDGLETIGPSSILNVQVDGRGVAGVTAAVRRVDIVTDFKPKIKSQEDAVRERDQMIARLSKQIQGTPRVLNQHIAYVDQGMSYVQPAYVWGVEWKGPTGKAANLVTVPIFANTPEPIMDMSTMTNGKPPVDGKPKASIEGEDILYAGLAPQANPIQIGMYVVRNDDSCWVSSAWGFWSNVTHGGGPSRNLLQYWWNHEDWWQTSTRRWVAGQVHVALLEGHGAPWLITTRDNGHDIIHLNQIAGFGSLMGGGEKTAYVIWHSCDVIPVPGDPMGGDFNSGSAWDVWWHLFRGMRGTYGYRTTMAICDGVMSGFGDHAGRGSANVSAWMNETGGQWWLRFWNGWDHGSAVILAGHENDCIYDNNGSPAPGSLTMWWN